MTLAYLALGAAVGLALLFGWALCRIGAISDQRIEGGRDDRV